MRRLTKPNFKRAIMETLKGLAAFAAALAIIAFSPLLEWSGYSKPSLAAAVATIIMAVVIMTPIFLITGLLNGKSDLER